MRKALGFTATTGSIPYYNSAATAQQGNHISKGGMQNNTSNNNTGGNAKTIPKLANIPPGNNTKIITQNKKYC